MWQNVNYQLWMISIWTILYSLFCAFSKSFTIKILILLLEEKHFNSQKILSLIGGKIPPGRLTFRQLFHTRQETNKRPSYSLCKITSTKYSTPVFPACSPAKRHVSLSEVSETKQTLLQSAYSTARGQPLRNHMNSPLCTRPGFQIFWPRIVPRAELRHAMQLT